MSHFSRVKTAFRDRSVLAHCLEEMGYQVEHGGTVRGYHGVQQVDLAVAGRDGYGVGFVRNADGCYDLLADSWGVKGEDKRVLARLRRDYPRRMVQEQARREGYTMVEEAMQEDGSIRIVVRRWA
ncbi:MAG: hypothetical protein A4E37_00982 [Methanoregulaceae archaeon PtaB.Bin056]|nr:MAG: hypothetical protein A4E37_00982 [Methanoregulaceae archaeon PtaB.Bin056]